MKNLHTIFICKDCIKGHFLLRNHICINIQCIFYIEKSKYPEIYGTTPSKYQIELSQIVNEYVLDLIKSNEI
jgi:hypothetical protein